MALTKIDILDKLDEIKIGVNYVKNGKVMEHYPSNVYQCEGRVDHEFYQILELQWRQAPLCSSWDTGRVAPLIFSPGVKSLN